MVKKNIPVGIKKKRGFPTTPRPRKVKQKKKVFFFTHVHFNTMKNVQRNRFISDLVQEVCGYAPYEGRLMELMSLQGATHSAEKRPLRFAKKRVCVFNCINCTTAWIH